ncbi:MAG TPA: BON domain-containing protein [Vicinamibacterales bacterium]|nr:BON domain-containing protein [Vicinamibacterales bacterium]
MRRQHLGYVLLALAMLGTPACSRSDNTTHSSGRDAAPAAQAAGQTSEPEPGPGPAPAARPEPRTPAERPDPVAGTTGMMTRTTADPAEVGPDAAITMKIQAKYADDDVVSGRDIDVDTARGVVTLKGSVDSLHERDAAEQLARETEGVKRVVNVLKVAPR